MYPHHEQSIQKLINYFAGQSDVIAIILGGSVAKGLERPDSDIDAMIVVSDERYQRHLESNNVAECISGECTYEGGYFDIKYCMKSFLQDVAEKGSEPARNAFPCARCLTSTDPEIPEIVSRIPVYQIQEKADKQLSFYSALSLSEGYLWWMSKIDNPYLRVRAATDIVLYGYRLLLAENEVLFPCHKALTATIERLPRKPKNIVEKANRLLAELSDESKEDFVKSVMDFITYTPPADYSEVLTRYVDDNEKWWQNNRPNIAEW